jgi:hypothetical protein
MWIRKKDAPKIIILKSSKIKQILATQLNPKATKNIGLGFFDVLQYKNINPGNKKGFVNQIISVSL